MQTTIEWTEQDIADYKEAFLIFDKDKDGKINAKELREVLISLKLEATDKVVRDMINAATEDDPYSSGTITFDQFTSMAKKKFLHTMTDEQVIKEVFRLFDASDKGYITSQELRKVMAEFGQKLTDKEAQQMLVDADKDKDGKLTYGDFEALLKSKIELKY
eukprot:TRINITY_DN1734_c1_g1_i1.p1 TRINITY_DN1734_c1_g1~~TRINITY_DN1734_c1_g1_i1.p1  ORF type:complete len:168 (-),score=52.91 TRINITY_DN1734_c1_g1_i1:260-742(-)